MEQQPGSDILIALGQFGIRHRGRSVRRAREVFIPDECGTGAKDGMTMLLANPVRLRHFDDLWLDFPGDEYRPVVGRDFSSAPVCYFSGGQVEFGAGGVGGVDADYGSVSFLLPQCP
jgi:hypothetical protein